MGCYKQYFCDRCYKNIKHSELNRIYLSSSDIELGLCDECNAKIHEIILDVVTKKALDETKKGLSL